MNATKTCLSLIVTTLASAASAAPMLLFPALSSDRWGFVDQTRNVVINPQFERAEPFASALAAVRLSNWGYVDSSGKFAINPQFDEAGPFSEGLAAVRLSGRHGYVNPAGK